MYIKMIGQDKITQDKLDALKLKLPHGGLTRIANDLNITRHSVEKVFAGKWENDQVIDKAIEIIEERRRQVEEREARIDQALNI